MSTTVLVVDDAADVRAVLRVALRVRGGFEIVAEAETGEQAVGLAATHRPDVIVLDLGLPDLAGRDLLTRIRRESPTSRVVVFSGGDNDRAWFEQRSAGYVVKGEEIDRLLQVVADVASDQTHDTASLELPGEQIAPREARAVVRDLLHRWGFRDLVDEATVVVSELVANAVEHAGSVCTVLVERAEGSIRIEVRDEGPRADLPGATPGTAPGPVSRDAERGRGLMIVSALATEWGVDATERSKSVWVELARPGSSDPAPRADAG
jgi:DNA-binding NarL/FixJ family response regulator